MLSNVPGVWILWGSCFDPPGQPDLQPLNRSTRGCQTCHSQVHRSWPADANGDCFWHADFKALTFPPAPTNGAQHPALKALYQHHYGSLSQTTAFPPNHGKPYRAKYTWSDGVAVLSAPPLPLPASTTYSTKRPLPLGFTTNSEECPAQSAAGILMSALSSCESETHRGNVPLLIKNQKYIEKTYHN